jgi:hypothetical protein
MNLRETISKVIKEALGVPDNIYETSVDVYNEILKQLDQPPHIKHDDDEVKLYFMIEKGLRISDFLLPRILIEFTIHVDEDYEEFELVSMNVQSETERPTEDNPSKLKKTEVEDLIMNSVFVGPETFVLEDFKKFIISIKSEFITSISHELKHAYDHTKGEYESVEYRAGYNAIAGKKFNINCVDLFFHDLYYVMASENLVRPTEIATAIKENKISQKDFLKFLNNNTTYQNLKRISQFTLEGFKDCLRKETKSVDKFFYHVGGGEGLSEEEKVNKIIELVYINLVNWKVEAFKEILTSEFIEEILGFRGQKKKTFQKFINKISRFEKNPEDFFRYEEKNFRDVADKMIRKISKLHAITNQEPVKS